MYKYAAVALATLVSSAAFPGAEPARAQRKPDNSFLVTNVRVFDGERSAERTQVAVTEGRIRTIGQNLSKWRELPTIDGTGATLLPGFIDAHAHVRDADELRQALRFGVTTVLDMGATVEPQALFALRSQASTSPDMADLRVASFPARAPGGLPDPRVATARPTVETVELAKAFAAARRAEGADYLKIMLRGVRSAQSGVPNLDAPRVTALVDTAHANGMLAVAHIETLDDTEIALAAGIDGLVHVWRQGGPSPDLARRLRGRRVFVVPTLAVMDGFLPDGGRSRLLADPRFQEFLSMKIKDQLGGTFVPSATGMTNAGFEAARAAVRNLHDVRVNLVVGSDAAVGNPTAHGISVHRELELLSSAGLTNAEVLAAATMNAADAFRFADRGRILPGRRADMLLVRGNPLIDMLATRDILRVWKSGVDVDRRLVGRQ